MSDNLWEELLSVIILNSAVRTNLHKGSSHGVTSSDVLPVHLGRCNISAFMSTCGTLAWPCACASLSACALSLWWTLSCTLRGSEGLRLPFYEFLDLLLLCSGRFPELLCLVEDHGFSFAPRGAGYRLKAFNLNASLIFPCFWLLKQRLWHSCESCAFV